MQMTSKAKRFNLPTPSRTRLIGRRRPNSRIYSPQRQIPIWEIRKTTLARAGKEFRAPYQSGPQPGGLTRWLGEPPGGMTSQRHHAHVTHTVTAVLPSDHSHVAQAPVPQRRGHKRRALSTVAASQIT